jgi:hypothetical protein
MTVAKMFALAKLVSYGKTLTVANVGQEHVMKKIVVLSLFASVSAFAFPQYVGEIPNGSCARCHVSMSGGGARNSFGQAFEAAGESWTAALCGADADADGQSNGLELGDPECVWTTGAAPITMDISNPGDAASTTDRGGGGEGEGEGEGEGGEGEGEGEGEGGGGGCTGGGAASLMLLPSVLLRRRRR